jgi:hypothetical protein
VILFSAAVYAVIFPIIVDGLSRYNLFIRKVGRPYKKNATATRKLKYNDRDFYEQDCIIIMKLRCIDYYAFLSLLDNSKNIIKICS